ncbi:MAG: hypothetical protein PHF29_05400 [Candidatus Riflebacteria bacterium]|nr:hypothetical protein [Candidatus Riflebacteria bacterium]
MPLNACDAGDFVYEEFGLRCQNIGIMIKNLQAALKMNMPNSVQMRANISNEWVSFYLSHGEEPPASFTKVLPEIWKETMTFAGQKITDLVFERTHPDEADEVCIVFDMLALEKNMSSAHEAMNSWKSESQKEVGESVASVTKWLGQNLNAYIEVSGVVAKNYPAYESRRANFINSIKMEWQEVLKASGDVQEVLAKFTTSRLVNKILLEYNRFKIMLFYR